MLTFRLWGASIAHDVEEAAVDLSQITYEREETEKSRQAIKEALGIVNCSEKEEVP